MSTRPIFWKDTDYEAGVEVDSIIVNTHATGDCNGYDVDNAVEAIINRLDGENKKLVEVRTIMPNGGVKCARKESGGEVIKDWLVLPKTYQSAQNENREK